MRIPNRVMHSCTPGVVKRRALTACVRAVLCTAASLFWFANARALTKADIPTPATLGAKIFHDVSLSASGRMSCATCHDPAHAHAPANALAVQPGGADL